MSEQQPKELTLDSLKQAVRLAAAFRLRAKLNAMGGDGEKVFPPTYAGGVYAVENRRIGDKVVRCVLLDSVQSQANRMEDALQNAFLPSWRDLDPNISTAVQLPCDLPLLAVHIENHGWVTSLTAPHRIHDAIIRDSEVEESTDNGNPIPFRKSAIGQEIRAARVHAATALFRHCPTALIFGTWDSTAGEGLNSAKIPRAIVSEIIGVDITPGVRTASRIDPLGIRASSATVYRLKDAQNDWTLDESEADEGKNGPKRFNKGKPSDINHGNVTPDMPRFDRQEIRDQKLGQLPDILSSNEGAPIRDGAVKPGGVTMAYALHTWTLSLTQLRRLRFPPGSSCKDQSVAEGGSAEKDLRNAATPEPHEAARTVLAALALYALALQQEQGYWLRSRCELAPEGPLVLEQIGGAEGMFSIGTAEQTRKLLDDAVGEAEKAACGWSKGVTVLTPTEKLRELVQRSDDHDPESDTEQEPANAGAAG